MTMEADIRVMWPQAKEHQQPPETRRGKEDSFLDTTEGV